ncbi:hypothetical protein CHCC20441_1925 [Bacillus licheniformis]|nr:hypothetical protein CHCC5026_1060 [Bacillus licheniformis]TWJ90402.1 hypothetical protein CHCC20493_4438 [Bacillus licheniformis]TWK09057.1 hypothetical protein CHCC20441_1925 [Bacillus licheniformis]TWK16512.1 hypothetical protein CHCC20440_3960 [Bacillus licheniformis]TWK60796.1 hypothetical protein CHCC20343_3718 [Bacillus licheniformis]
MKHRSAEPGIGCCAFGSNYFPASWRFIFCLPNVALFFLLEK